MSVTASGSESSPRNFFSATRKAAYAVAEWLRQNDRDGSLERFFSPSLIEQERKVAEVEGWMLGIA